MRPISRNILGSKIKLRFCLISTLLFSYIVFSNNANAADPVLTIWPDFKIKGAPDFDNVGIRLIPISEQTQTLNAFSFVFIKQVQKSDPDNLRGHRIQTVIEAVKDDSGNNLVVNFGAPTIVNKIKVWSYLFFVGSKSDQLEIQILLTNEGSNYKLAIGFLPIPVGKPIDKDAVLKSQIEMNLKLLKNQWQSFYPTKNRDLCHIESIHPSLSAQHIKTNNNEHILQDLKLNGAVIKCKNGKNEKVQF